MSAPVRDLTFAERAVYGVCPACNAKHGAACDPNVGMSLGVTVSGGRVFGGAHLGRIKQAPSRVREVPANG